MAINDPVRITLTGVQLAKLCHEHEEIMAKILNMAAEHQRVPEVAKMTRWEKVKHLAWSDMSAVKDALAVQQLVKEYGKPAPPKSLAVTATQRVPDPAVTARTRELSQSPVLSPALKQQEPEPEFKPLPAPAGGAESLVEDLDYAARAREKADTWLRDYGEPVRKQVEDIKITANNISAPGRTPAARTIAKARLREEIDGMLSLVRQLDKEGKKLSVGEKAQVAMTAKGGYTLEDLKLSSRGLKQ